VRDRGVLDEFPKLTEADIYLWVMHHRETLEEREGHDVGPVESAEDYAELMTKPLNMSERVLEFLGVDSPRLPDSEAEEKRRRRRLRRWPRPRRSSGK